MQAPVDLKSKGNRQDAGISSRLQEKEVLADVQKPLGQQAKHLLEATIRLMQQTLNSQVAVFDTTKQSGKALQLEQVDNQLKFLNFPKVFFLIVSAQQVFLVLDDRLAKKSGLAEQENESD